MSDITTTTNIKNASIVLGEKIKRTETNMKAMMEQAGVTEYKTQKIMVPRSINENDDVLVIGLNGVMFHFLRGKSVSMPEPLVEIMENTGAL